MSFKCDRSFLNFRNKKLQLQQMIKFKNREKYCDYNAKYLIVST